MNSLAGELLAYPSPNRPGFWVCRKLADGSLLETELTREEWQAVHEAALGLKRVSSHKQERRLGKTGNTGPLMNKATNTGKKSSRL
jgi:hypothetical protein